MSRIALLLLAFWPALALAQESDQTPKALKNLKYRSIGPAAGGRVSQVAGVPGDPLTYYAATAMGGVWKSSDGGIHWEPIFDDQPVSSIGAIAVAPSDPNVVYVGSGEANIRGNVAAGNGIYVSTDAGKSWQHVWKQTGQIGAIAVHPTNADIAFAAVLGHVFGPNPQRGVYRTTDGGRSWQQVLAKDPDTGAIDVEINPQNPRIVYAALWQARRRPWEMTSGGPGSGLYRSTDGGDTWVRLHDGKGSELGKGLPPGPWGRVGIAIAPSQPERVYAMIEAHQGGLYRSDDGGATWALVGSEPTLRMRPWYFSTLTVDPKNPDIVYVSQVYLQKSIDGGKTFRRVLGTHHVDHHHTWIDPHNPKRMIVANDGGVDVTVNGGKTWYAPALPICQFYHIACDNRTPYHVMGNMQDMGTAAGPSHSLSAEGLTLSHWYNVGGGETGYSVPDPSDPNIVYSGEYGGYLSRYDHRTKQVRPISPWPFNPSGIDPARLKYRFQWTAPVLISPHDPKTVYHAANVIFRTRNGGQDWEAISPDLTRDDKQKQQWSGGPITGDNTGVEVYCTVFALAESPVKSKEPPLLWAGSDDGLVHVSRDGGKTWQNVTANIPGLPDWGTVRVIVASPHDAQTAYVVVDAHRLDDTRPYLWKTNDGGKTWVSLAAGLAQDVYLHVVREDPKQRGLLFVGTERGVAYSPDDGKTWHSLQLNLPTVAVSDLVVKNDDLVLGTNGRSIWILDNITSLRAWAKQSAEPAGKRRPAANPGPPKLAYKQAHLFEPAPAIRWNLHTNVTAHTERYKADNPPDGAIIDYYLKAKLPDGLTLEILGPDGQRVAKFESGKEAPEPDATLPDGPPLERRVPRLKNEPGIQRFVWDMRHEGANPIPGAKVDMGGLTEGPRVRPGVYTVKLTAAGQTQTAKLQVLQDPRALAHPTEKGDPAAQEALALQLRDQINRLTELTKQVRSLKAQIAARAKLLADDPDAAKLLAASKDFAKQLDELEEELHNPRAKVSYNILAQRGGAKLYSQLAWLYELVGMGDFGPTTPLRNQAAAHMQQLDQLSKRFDTLRTETLPKLNALATQGGYPTLYLPRPSTQPTK